jgi:hypothetical protein
MFLFLAVLHVVVLFFLRIAAFGLFPSVKTRNGVFQIIILNTPFFSISAHTAVIEQVNLFATPAGQVR